MSTLGHMGLDVPKASGKSMGRVVVLGTGSWGTAAAGLVARNARTVVVCARRPEIAEGINRTRRNPAHLSDYELPENVSATVDAPAALRGADAILVAVPSAHLRAVLRAARDAIAADVPVCLLAKGVAADGALLAEVARKALGGGGRVAVLGGPNHAEEISAAQVSAAVVASENQQVAAVFRRLFASVSFRAYASSDVVGVSLCGACKNVVAIAAGIGAALGVGDNALAVLMTRGLAEMGRIVVAEGGDPLTCMGLAGMGDLVATCTSPHSRNRAFGVACASGVDVASYEASTGMVVEGAAAVPGIVALARARGVETPIAAAINAILYEGVPVGDAVASLLVRPPSEEFYGFATQGGADAR